MPGSGSMAIFIHSQHFKMMLSPETHVLFADGELTVDAQNQHSLWSTLSCFSALLLLTTLGGFIVALAVFLTVFIRI